MQNSPLIDSIIACFGSRFTVVMMPSARRYRAFPLGTFHYFDWQKTENVGISIGTCPQIVSSETMRLGISADDVTRILPFDEDHIFADINQEITPLTTTFHVKDPALPVQASFEFRSAFYPQNFEFSCAPAYQIAVTVENRTIEPAEVDVFLALPLQGTQVLPQGNGYILRQPVEFPDGIDHEGIYDLVFEQVVAGDGAAVNGSELRTVVQLKPGESRCIYFYHVGYIGQPSLNRRGSLLKFGYTALWDSPEAILAWWQARKDTIIRKGDLFESTVLDVQVPMELKSILAATFKGLASNAWWAEDDWFSVMEIGAYHSTLDVDYQLMLFFFQYWPELIARMINQWAAYYIPGSGYMAHDVGQHLEALGNRYGGPHSAMKVEENCNYLTLLHHYWRSTTDASVLQDKHKLMSELVDFLIASDTTGSGLPNQFTDNTNDWGTELVTASEEQSYHGVRLIVTYSAVAEIAAFLQDNELAERCLNQVALINESISAGWLGDHYPISLADEPTYHHYSMWTTHGVLYPLRSGMKLDIDLDRLRVDLISSTRRTMREHGCVHSTADVRGWLTQNLWRDCIAAYLGVDLTDNLTRYLGHGEYVSYEDTTILEVANELMVVPGAIAEHTYAGERHNFAMVDGHPRPACAFGLLYALAGVQYDAIEKRLSFAPIAFPLSIALTHLADWENEKVPRVSFRRSIPNQDAGSKAWSVTYQIEEELLPYDLTIILKQ